MADTKTHSASGHHQSDAALNVIFYIDFNGGTGSATLQRKLGNSWVPVRGPFTETMTEADITEIPIEFNRSVFRWDVTVSSGSPITYLEAGRDQLKKFS